MPTRFELPPSDDGPNDHAADNQKRDDESQDNFNIESDDINNPSDPDIVKKLKREVKIEGIKEKEAEALKQILRENHPDASEEVLKEAHEATIGKHDDLLEISANAKLDREQAEKELKVLEEQMEQVKAETKAKEKELTEEFRTKSNELQRELEEKRKHLTLFALDLQPLKDLITNLKEWFTKK